MEYNQTSQEQDSNNTPSRVKPTPTRTFDFGVFYSIFSVILGALGGFLIAVPVSYNIVQGGSSTSILAATFVMPLFAVIGGGVGYRRRHSRLFFYVSFLTVLILLSMISSSLSRQ